LNTGVGQRPDARGERRVERAEPRRAHADRAHHGERLAHRAGKDAAVRTARELLAQGQTAQGVDRVVEVEHQLGPRDARELPAPVRAQPRARERSGQLRGRVPRRRLRVGAQPLHRRGVPPPSRRAAAAW
jgi:hypothetical protein